MTPYSRFSSWVYSSALPANQTVGHNVYQINPAHKKPNASFQDGEDDDPQIKGDVYVEPSQLPLYSTKVKYVN